MNLKAKAKQLKTDIPAVMIALKHKDTPIIAKILSAITIIYALSPLDLIPDFIPVLGYLDDVILLPLFITLTIKLIPNDIFKACQVEAETRYKDVNMKRWYYSIPIILIWCFIIYYLVKIFN